MDPASGDRHALCLRRFFLVDFCLLGDFRYQGNFGRRFFGVFHDVISILGLQILGRQPSTSDALRVYLSKHTRERLGVKVAILGLLALAARAGYAVHPGDDNLLSQLIFAWAFQHQLAQAYGVALIYCYKRKYYMNKAEKNVMFGMVYARLLT